MRGRRGITVGRLSSSLLFTAPPYYNAHNERFSLKTIFRQPTPPLSPHPQHSSRLPLFPPSPPRSCSQPAHLGLLRADPCSERPSRLLRLGLGFRRGRGRGPALRRRFLPPLLLFLRRRRRRTRRRSG